MKLGIPSLSLPTRAAGENASLWRTAREAPFEKVMAMLQSGSKDVDPKAVVDDVTGDTLLHVVAENNNVEGMRFLLDRKCNPNALNKKVSDTIMLVHLLSADAVCAAACVLGSAAGRHTTVFGCKEWQ